MRVKEHDKLPYPKYVTLADLCVSVLLTHTVELTGFDREVESSAIKDQLKVFAIVVSKSCSFLQCKCPLCFEARTSNNIWSLTLFVHIYKRNK